MKIAQILKGQAISQTGFDLDTEADSLGYDSRRVRPGTLFFALRGEAADGNDFARVALDAGAVAVVSDRPAQPELTDWWIRVENSRRALALAAGNFCGRADRKLDLIGVTGTNGKTTVCFLLEAILKAAGRRPGLLGTVEYRVGGRRFAAAYTTPESLELQSYFAEILREGGKAAVMEVSSHALAQDRIYGCRFKAAVLTNLTRDHLDYHGTMEEYRAAKQKLFVDVGAGPPDLAVINADDPWGSSLAASTPSRKITYGFASQADVHPIKWQGSFSGLEATLATPAGTVTLKSSMVGEHNMANLLAAVATGIGLGLPREAIEKGVAELPSVPGRFERVEAGQPFLVVVDYAHTDDALERAIQAARKLNPKRLITVFGCGGCRDRGKRPRMGEAAGKGSDLAVLTSDNPRTEDPLRILNDVRVGLERSGGRYVMEEDRAKAIRLALEEASDGDLVLVAGKGHETRQILADREIEFDDREVCRDVLREFGYGKRSPHGA